MRRYVAVDPYGHGESIRCPTMQGSIVVGVDGSERSHDALVLAGVLAQVLGGGLLIAHVHPYRDLSSLLSEGEYEGLVREVAESTLAQSEEALPDGVEREMRLVEDRSPAGGLDRAARESEAFLVVVGSSHRAGLGKVLPGTIGDRLLSGSSVPVAVAPRGYATRTDAPEIAAIGCGFDGSAESRQALELATKLARAASAELRVLGVHTALAFGHVSAGAFPTESVNQALRRRLQEEVEAAGRGLPDDVRSTASVVDGDPVQVLVAQSEEMDLLMLGSRGYGPLRSVLLGSVSSSVVEQSSCPVVVAPRGIA
jgi:nucleotide-binding universal stress UspA family protein